MKKFYLIAAALATMATMQATPDVITPPEGLNTNPYLVRAQELTIDNNKEIYTPVYLPVTMGVDAGNNIYLKGLCPDLPEAWVQASHNGDNDLVIASGQYLGYVTSNYFGYEYTYEHYLLGYGASGLQDIVLAYDAESGTYSGEDVYIIDNDNATTLTSPYHVFTQSQMQLVEERSAKPANPQITDFVYNESNRYTYINCMIPVEDVQGNPLLADKLYYRIYGDMEHEIMRLKFSPGLYSHLTQSMTEIPYSFTDGYDIARAGAMVYLNQPTVSYFNRVGIQTVYYGEDADAAPVIGADGDVAFNESDIVWYEIKDYYETAVSDVAVSKELKSVRYYNANGNESNVPFDGINIVVRTYGDGSTTATKVVK